MVSRATRHPDGPDHGGTWQVDKEVSANAGRFSNHLLYSLLRSTQETHEQGDKDQLG